MMATTTVTPIRVLAVDDHALIRAGIAALANSRTHAVTVALRRGILAL